MSDQKGPPGYIPLTIHELSGNGKSTNNNGHSRSNGSRRNSESEGGRSSGHSRGASASSSRNSEGRSAESSRGSRSRRKPRRGNGVRKDSDNTGRGSDRRGDFEQEAEGEDEF